MVISHQKQVLKMKHFKIIIILLFITPFVWGQDCISGDCENGFGTKKWMLASYTGLFKEGLKHGQGIYESKFSGSYKGGFREGFFEGDGVRIYHDSTLYKGEFKYDKRHGKGKITYTTGNTYDGDWQFNYKHGQGLIRNKDGYSYAGLMKFNKKHGKGKQKWKSGSVYIGAFKGGLREGYGVYTWPSGETYKGNWKSGGKHGIGISKNKFDKIINKGLWFEGDHKSNETGCLENNSCVDERWCCLIAQQEREIYFVNNQKFLLDKNQLINFLENNPNAKKRYFYDKDWNVTSQENSKYYREIFDYDKETNTYVVRDYFTDENTLQFKGRAQNISPNATDNASLVIEGKAFWYYENNFLFSETNSLEGRLHGKSIYYFKNGKTNVTNYDRGKTIKK